MPTWEWPPPLYDEVEGYVDNVDIVFAVIVNSLVEKIESLIMGTDSAYTVYFDNTTDSPKKTVTQWLASLKGADGVPGVNGTNGTNGSPGAPGQDGVGIVVVNYGATTVPAGTPSGSIVFVRPAP